MINRALIILAHGSRNGNANSEIIELSKKVFPLVKNDYGIVKTAFLEFAKPSFEESIKNCIESGLSSIVILPYFLASGKHVSHDIPEIIKKMKKKFPKTDIVLKKHVGSRPDMSILLANMLK